MNGKRPFEGKQPGKGLQREPRSPEDLVDQGSGTLDPAQPHVTGPAADQPNPDKKGP